MSGAASSGPATSGGARALEVQHAVLSALLEHPTVQAAGPQLLRAVCAALDCEVGAVWLVDQEPDVLRCVATWARDPDHVAAFLAATTGRTFRREEGLPGRVWARAEPLSLSDVLVDGNFPRRDAATGCGLHGAFAFPVLGAGQVLGVVEGFSAVVGSMEPDMLHAIGSVGREIGLALLREQTERRSAELGARLAVLVGNLRPGILVEDEHRRIALVNRAFCDLFGIAADPGSLVGADCAQAAENVKHLFRSPDGFVARTSAALAGRREVLGEELVLLDGRVFERDYVPIFVRDAYAGHLWAYRDVTGQRQAHAKLAASEARLRAILEAALDCVITIDTTGKVLDFSAAAERTFGFPRDAVLGRPLVDLIVPARFRDAHLQGLKHYLATGEGPVLHRRIEVSAVRADGGEFPVELAITPVRLPDGQQVFTAFLRDITDQRRAQEALQAARVEAEGLAAAREQFLANISHELRTPLNAIVGLAHLLEGTPLDAEQERHLQGIRFAGDALLTVVNDLLDYARIRSDKITLEATAFDLRPLLDGIVNAVGAAARERGLALALEVAPDVPPTVVGDPGRLNQVLFNLVGNAIKFTERGSVTIRAERVARDEGVLTLRFSVADTGIGIADEDRQRIFEAFQQARPDTTRRFGGSGLGLAIVQELVRRQGGTVSVESAVGLGSTFSVTLPFGVPAEATPSAPEPAVPSSLAGRRILLVEDNEMNRVVATRILERAGAEVVTAHDGAAALERLRVAPFDVVLMDIQMPGMDGYEATWRIRHDLGMAETQLPIIALTATALTEEHRRAEASGMTDFLLKPFRPEVLCQRVASVVAGRAGPAAAAAGPRVDRRLLEEYTQGQGDFAREILTIWLRTAPEQLHQLEAAATANDRAAIGALAHRMKSSAATIGATGLFRAMEDLERAARAPDRVDPAALAARVRAAVAEGRAALPDAARVAAELAPPER